MVAQEQNAISTNQKIGAVAIFIYAFCVLNFFTFQNDFGAIDFQCATVRPWEAVVVSGLPFLWLATRAPKNAIDKIFGTLFGVLFFGVLSLISLSLAFTDSTILGERKIDERVRTVTYEDCGFMSAPVFHEESETTVFPGIVWKRRIKYSRAEPSFVNEFSAPRRRKSHG